MAKKTRTQVFKRIWNIHKLKVKGLIRNPEYRKDIKEFNDKKIKQVNFYQSADNEVIKKYETMISGERNKLKKKYNISFLVDPDNPGADLCPHKMGELERPVVTLPDLNRREVDLKSLYKDKVEIIKIKNDLSLILGEDRWLTVKIDLNKDKEILIFELENLINFYKDEVNKLGLEKKHEIVPHLEKIDRYFRVFDLRNEKPPLSFKRIALNLIKDGLYKNKSLEQATALAKKDFCVAFRQVYGIAYKNYDKGKFKKIKFIGCKVCIKKENCKEPCAELEYLLVQEETKQKHYIGDKDVSEWDNI